MRIRNRFNRLTGTKRQRIPRKIGSIVCLVTPLSVKKILYFDLHPFEQEMADSISKRLLKKYSIKII
jgi:hypothetical protein